MRRRLNIIVIIIFIISIIIIIIIIVVIIGTRSRPSPGTPATCRQDETRLVRFILAFLPMPEFQCSTRKEECSSIHL
jgi:hypothetical protein